MVERIIVLVSVVAFGVSCLSAGYSVGQSRMQAPFDTCRMALDAANDRLDDYRRGPVGCVCEPVTTVTP